MVYGRVVDNNADEAQVAVALVTAALAIDMEEGETSADQLSYLVLETAHEHRDDPPYTAQVMAYLASYAAVLINMVAEATETEDPMMIHQSMALAIATTEETA